jgi:hypothetical protein
MIPVACRVAIGLDAWGGLQKMASISRLPPLRVKRSTS